MTALTYSEQLRHPNWQRRRLEIMQRDDFTCQICQDTGATLNVHHKHYVKGRQVWEYEDHVLVTLCEACHGQEHEDSEAHKNLLAQLPLDGPTCKHNAMGLIAGWADGFCGYDLRSWVQEEPVHFAVGQVAAYLDGLDLESLFRFADCIRALPHDIRTTELEAFIAKLGETVQAFKEGRIA